MMGDRNHEDSRPKADATAAGKRRRWERGDSAGPLPFGYRLVDALDSDGHVMREGDRIIRRREPEPDEARIVTEMAYTLRADRA